MKKPVRNACLLALMSLSLPLLFCGSEQLTDEEHRDNYLEESVYPTEHEVYRSYRVDGVTPNLGVRYQNSGQPLNEADELKMEEVVAYVYGCLRDLFPSGSMTTEDKRKFACYYKGGVYFPDFGDFVVVVSGNWRKSCISDQQVLSDATLPTYITCKKGTNPTKQCPCVWRSIFRRASDGTPLFVTTPSMYMLGDVMTRWMTGCGNPWITKEPLIVKCATPIVPPVP